MTAEQIRYSLETGKLKLEGWSKFIHYSPVGGMFGIALPGICFHFYSGILSPFDWMFIIPPLILGIWFYRLQRNKLKFKVVETNLSKEELADVIGNVAGKLKWTLKTIEDNVVIAKTDPGFFSGSWGEQITILLDRNKVLVNS